MYTINSDKVNTTIALLSDIHYSKYLNKNTLNIIISKLNDIKPDYICIPGDFIDEAIDLDNNIITFFKTISKISTVILSLGNHDICKFIKHKSIYYRNEKLKELKKINNLYLLDNEQITINNITFTGYTLYPNNGSYSDNTNVFLKDLKTLNFKTSNSYNILLSHSPQSILGDKKVYNHKFIKNQDLILCGHMHNGMILHYFNKFNHHFGLVGPYKTFFPKYSRGIFNFNKTTLIISKGITKVGKKAKLLKFLNIFYPIDIEVIKIKKY